MFGAINVGNWPRPEFLNFDVITKCIFLFGLWNFEVFALANSISITTEGSHLKHQKMGTVIIVFHWQRPKTHYLCLKSILWQRIFVFNYIQILLKCSLLRLDYFLKYDKVVPRLYYDIIIFQYNAVVLV